MGVNAGTRGGGIWLQPLLRIFAYISYMHHRLCSLISCSACETAARAGSCAWCWKDSSLHSGSYGSILGVWQCRSRALMAVARKIKTLLTVNILVFVGIILFSVYCRIQDRSEELVQIGRLSDQRLRGRNAKVTNSMDRQSILKRLERLEDVVYNQLNGMWALSIFNVHMHYIMHDRSVFYGHLDMILSRFTLWIWLGLSS